MWLFIQMRWSPRRLANHELLRLLVLLNYSYSNALAVRVRGHSDNGVQSHANAATCVIDLECSNCKLIGSGIISLLARVLSGVYNFTIYRLRWWSVTGIVTVIDIVSIENMPKLSDNNRILPFVCSRVSLSCLSLSRYLHNSNRHAMRWFYCLWFFLFFR